MNPYVRYLAAKKSVDDRALSPRVWEALGAALQAVPRPIRIIELGGGIGTMLERILERGLCPMLEYRMVEREFHFLAAFRERLPRWVLERGGSVSALDGDRFRIAVFGVEAMATAVCGDLHNVVACDGEAGRWDAVMAHGVMDLVDIDRVLPGCCRLTGPGGLLSLTLNYDGETILTPSWPDSFERLLFERYHLTMDRRTAEGRPTGASRSGRRLIEAAAGLGLHRLAADPSDWMVAPVDGRYPAEEGAFLETILATIEKALGGDPVIDPARLEDWGRQRRGALHRGLLGFRARNLDLLFRVPSAGAVPTPETMARQDD